MRTLTLHRKAHIDSRYIIALPIVVTMLAIVINPTRYIKSASGGLIIFATSVLPSIFPFFFFTKILTSIGMSESISRVLGRPFSKVYRVHPVSGYIFFMSIISGYPVGARLIADMYAMNVIDEDEAKRISTFTSIGSPLFIIGTVGTVLLGKPLYGYIIYASQVIALLLNGFIYRGKIHAKTITNSKLSPLNLDNALEESILSSIKSVLIVGGYIVIFYIISDVFYDIGLLKSLSNLLALIFKNANIDSMIFDGISLGLVEMTHGIMLLSSANNVNILVPVISALISLGGACVTMQSLTYLKKAKIKVGFYLKSKLTQSIITLIVTIILMHIIV